MKIRRVEISNFRGIGSLDWSPQPNLVCIIGGGDVGKSTILDAIEATLSPKRTQFFDTDFIGADTSIPIEVKVTVGELPDALCDETYMGLYLRGWSETGELHDEPEADDEVVLTVRLAVDSSLDPTWEVMNDRDNVRNLSSKDRRDFGLVRLGGEPDGAFAWGQYSPLTQMVTDRTGTRNVLTEAYRQARDAIKTNPMTELAAAAKRARIAAIAMGAYSEGDFLPGLDTQRSSTSLATLSLHSLDVPLRLMGLGTKRLTSLAIQRLAVPEGSIVLIDELEHGLEPHRIRHALRTLQKPSALNETRMTGQVLITTHSSVTIEELGSSALAIASRSGTTLNLKIPDSSLEATIRKNSQSLLSRSILVCEGKTEVGVFRALRSWWASHNDGEPIECRGVSLTNGEGSGGVLTALNLKSLGYRVALFRDADVPLTSVEETDLATADVRVIEWPGSHSTEEAFFSSLPEDTVQTLLEIAYRERSIASVKDSILHELGITGAQQDDYRNWVTATISIDDIRAAIGRVSKRNGWFKRVNVGEEFGVIVREALVAGWNSPVVAILKHVEDWLYGH